MRLIKIIFSTLFILALPVAAQDESPKELFDDAVYFFNEEEYSEAAFLFNRLVKAEPDNYNALYRLGRAYLNIEGEEEKAIDFLLKSTGQTTFDYRADFYPEKRAPQHSWYYLANAYRADNQLDKALDAYERFMTVEGFETKYNPGVAQNEIKAIERAKIIRDAPLDLSMTCFAEPINSSGVEYSAVISADGNVLVWVNSQKFYEAVMMSQKIDGKWSRPVNITPQIKSDGDMFPTSLSADGTELLLVKHKSLDTDIYYSKFDGKIWSDALPLKGKANSNFYDDHASFLPGGNKILISSNRRGGEGGLDLWITERNNKGKWGKAKNLGPTINTESDETSAYVTPDGSKLIFSSEGHFNMGGFDLFVSDIDEKGEFGFPFNLGFPLNTTTDNKNFVPLGDGNTAIYCLRDQEGGVGNKDIWNIRINPKSATLKNALNKLSEENFEITIVNEKTGKTITLHYDADTDSVKATGDDGEVYAVFYK